MGNGSSSSKVKGSAFNNVSAVHLNGYVEHFETPVTVGELLGSDGSSHGAGKGRQPPRHFVCTRAQLLSATLEPLEPTARLEAGHIYFVLPFSAFKNEVSRLDLAALAKKLTAAAKACGAQAKRAAAGPAACPSPSRQAATYRSPSRQAPTCRSPSRRNASRKDIGWPPASSGEDDRSWRPVLDTIVESGRFSTISELAPN